MKNVRVWSRLFYAWSRSRPNLVGAGADPIWSEPESAPGPWTSGAGATKKWRLLKFATLPSNQSKRREYMYIYIRSVVEPVQP